MTTEPENENRKTRPVFKFLAGFFGVFFLIAGIFAAIFAFQSTGPAFRRWVVEASLFLLMGAAFVHAAFTGRWGLRR